MDLTWEAIIPKVTDPLDVLREVEVDFKRVVGPEIHAAFVQYTVDHNWSVPVNFNIRYETTKDYTSVYVFPAGGYGREIWEYVTLGTPEHDITPKNPRGALAFDWGGRGGSYKPKTAPFKTPLRLFSGRTAKETWVFKKVDHPGIEPRLIEEGIGDAYAPRFEEVVGAAFNRGVQKAR